MSEAPVTVTAVFRVRPGSEDAFLRAAGQVAAATRAEPGCLEYRLHRHTERAGSFVLYENWRSRGDLDAHLETPHLRAFVSEIEPALDGEIEVELWQELE